MDRGGGEGGGRREKSKADVPIIPAKSASGRSQTQVRSRAICRFRPNLRATKALGLMCLHAHSPAQLPSRLDADGNRAGSNGLRYQQVHLPTASPCLTIFSERYSPSKSTTVVTCVYSSIDQ